MTFEHFIKFKPDEKTIWYLSLENCAGFPYGTEMGLFISSTTCKASMRNEKCAFS